MSNTFNELVSLMLVRNELRKWSHLTDKIGVDPEVYHYMVVRIREGHATADECLALFNEASEYVAKTEKEEKAKPS